MVSKKVTKKVVKTTAKAKKPVKSVKKVASELLPTLEESVNKAIDIIKNSEYKGKYIKVELEGHFNRDRARWGNERCRQFLRENVSDKARSCLVYDRFYVDGSVDSEFTFTVPLDNVFEVVEFIKAFKKLSEACGHGMAVTGAGMHIAILNSSDGNYPGGNAYDRSYGNNFAYSMTKLLPALYFLGSSDAKSRPLNYRAPRVDMDNKYAAITGHNRVFEYRVFETCYNKPETFLDFVCVISKTLQFYGANKVVLPFFDKIGKLIMPDSGYHLSRFYFTANHLKALDLGLAILKPDHKTIEQLKKERSFDISESKIVEEDKRLEIELDAQYKREAQTFEKKIEARKKELSDWYDREQAVVPELVDYSKEEMIEIEVMKLQRENDHLTDKKKYIDNKKVEKLRSSKLYEVTV